MDPLGVARLLFPLLYRVPADATSARRGINTDPRYDSAVILSPPITRWLLRWLRADTAASTRGGEGTVRPVSTMLH